MIKAASLCPLWHRPNASNVVLSLISLGSILLTAEVSGQVPANYQGPTLFGVCAYVQGDTSYYSNIFSASGYYKFKAQEAFRQYALAQAKGAALRGSGCRWATSQEEVTTQKEADKRLLGLAGHSTKGVETGWSFVPPATNAAAASPVAASSAAVASPAAVTQTPAAARAARVSNTARTASPAAPATTQPTPNAATTSSGTAAAQSSSIVGGAQQSASGALADSKAAASTSINQGVASSITAASQGATSAIQGFFHRKPADPKPTQPADSRTPVAAPQSAAPMGFGNSESPLAATAEAHRIEGIVADVSDNDVVINVGIQAGVEVGMKLAVMHAVRVVKDPTTGKVLRTIENRVGDLTITNADAGSAQGKFAGTSKPAVGDTVRTPAL